MTSTESTSTPAPDVTKNPATEFSHVGIQVRDLSVSLPFYRDQIGLEVVAEWVVEDPTTREAIDLPQATLNMAVLRLPGTNAYMEVIEYQNVERTPVDPYHPNPGTCHIAWYVDDIDELYDRLVGMGLEPVSRRVVPIDGGPLDGGKVIYMTDPDGIRIEFLESSLYLDATPRVTR
ncbi:VOC family protein [Nocardioides zeae]|uniref:VOC family protein n=1 Tax=Nocardioides imazamoxiresistens TaxID=3231893 RepID=A0ABU3PVS6_9ACTN|nr:VOC family protein [Nocardioides zeae]MDT9593299.1 VOC family protein [Nocardioides zeae]